MKKLIKKLALPNDPSERCGYRGFSYGKTHPFHECCAAHDRAYKSVEDGAILDRREVDRALLQCCLKKAGASPFSKAEAYLFYAIVRAVGWAVW